MFFRQKKEEFPILVGKDSRPSNRETTVQQNPPALTDRIRKNGNPVSPD
ncbi:hypothetical protein B4135_0724 [Caldibacillus debilis]|uniref:Uncharacterized protein n=1 Tax=Caldibacillus debilis TaxID=301148 RepID=A0A150M5Y7_9BACI|nr:hypothetical protein B4135_0724 [Caldibacillus debilis]